MNSVNLEKWVLQAPSSDQKEFREAVHTILVAIANEPRLQADMVIKGGILLAICFESSRYTRDIDFSTHKLPAEVSMEEVENLLNSGLIFAVETLNYDLDCRVQSCKMNPASKEASYPTMQLTIGYAYKGSPKHNKLQAKQSSTIVSIDYSLNEITPNIDELNINDNEFIKAYSLSDLVAEKFRSLLQQEERNRNRRQDVYDLFLLIGQHGEALKLEKNRILDALLQKSKGRNIAPKKSSLRDDKIRARSEAEYQTLADEIQGELPDFTMAYDTIKSFYETLDWVAE